MKKVITGIILGSVFLSGCATMTAKQQKQLNLVVAKCPVLTKYSKEQLQQAASELGTLPSKSQLSKLVVDYGKLRDACRAIERKVRKSSAGS